MALAPLALACMAPDAGCPIDVESEYLPRELLEFGWVGEADASKLKHFKDLSLCEKAWEL